MRHRTDVPDVAEDGAGVGNEERGKLPIVGPGLGNGALVNLARGFVEEKRKRRNVGLGTVEADVALALLLGIVKRMRVEEGPDELAADVFEAEFEMGMLENGVMAAVKGGGTDVEALLVCDFIGSDEVRGIAGARGGDSGIEGMEKRIAQGDTGSARFHQAGVRCAIKHARLRSHVGRRFYTESWRRTKG